MHILFIPYLVDLLFLVCVFSSYKQNSRKTGTESEKNQWKVPDEGYHVNIQVRF